MRLVNENARVRVPATSANLGPGFDAFGLAVAIYDELSVHTSISGGAEVRVSGEGAGQLATGEDHLVVKALRVGLDWAGAPQIGLQLRCENRIPHGRGLGSSAAAVVAGLLLARGLIADPLALDNAAILELATEFEGHPDNAAPAIFGGATIAWVEEQALVAAVEVAAGLPLTVLIPREKLPTKMARQALPAMVPHKQAAFNAGRAGLLPLALGGRFELLFAATADQLHQDYRAEAMPTSHALLCFLRERGLPAVISGAGPTVAVFGQLPVEMSAELAELQWQVLQPGIDMKGACLLG